MSKEKTKQKTQEKRKMGVAEPQAGRPVGGKRDRVDPAQQGSRRQLPIVERVLFGIQGKRIGRALELFSFYGGLAGGIRGVPCIQGALL